MAGGTWTSQNKSRPGVYIRFTSSRGLGITVGDRGTVTICEPMSWGPVGQVMTVAAGDDMTPYCGYDITAPQAQFINEIFKGSNRTAAPNTLLLYRPTASSSAQATATTGVLTATALYPGVRGNDISIVVTDVVDEEGTFTVSTVVDGVVVDEQTGASVSDLVANDWVTWSGTGALTATTGVPLTGGLDGTVQSAAYSTYLAAIEPYKFDIMIYDGDDSTVQDAMVAFIKRIADENGQYSQLVASGLTNPDSRYVIDVESGVTLSSGVQLTAQQATWWVGGAEAGAMYNQSLTYASYPGAISCTPVMTNAQYIAAINAGQLVFNADDNIVRIETDINSLTTFTTDITNVYRKNRVMRLCNTIANDVYKQFSQNFIGVVNNNEQGRALFQSAIVGYLLDIQGNQGIQNFSAEDVQVLPGTDIDAIVVNVAIQAVDSVEKIYMTIEIN